MSLTNETMQNDSLIKEKRDAMQHDSKSTIRERFRLRHSVKRSILQPMKARVLTSRTYSVSQSRTAY